VDDFRRTSNGGIIGSTSKIIHAGLLPEFLNDSTTSKRLIARVNEYYDKYPGQFVAKMGAEGIKDLLEEINLDEELKF
jgi:hypothetical protein